MKTNIIIFFVVAAMSAQAASFSWGTTTKTQFNGSAVGGISASLIYLGAVDSIQGVTYTVTSDLTESGVISLIGTDTGSDATSSTSAMTKGKLSGTYTFDSGVADGDYFAILLTYTSDDKTYYNLSNASAASYDSVVGAWNGFSTTAQWNTSASTEGALSAGGGWVAAAAVPEPATGALALAGIALLFKRRKVRA